MQTGGGRSGVRDALNDMLWLLPVPLVLIVLSRMGARLSDAAIAGVVLALVLLMAGGIWMRAVVRRRIFLAGALQRRSRWYRWLRGGVGLALLALLVALPLAVILVVATVRPTGPHLLLGMVLNVPVLVLLHHQWVRWLSAHAEPRFTPVLALRVALAVNFLLLFLALGLAALFQSYPDLGELTLAEAMLSEAGRQVAAGDLLLGMMQLAAAKDAAVWWLGQQVLPGVMQPGLQFAAWVLLLATDALVVWSYLLICSSVLTLRHWRAWYPGTGS